MAMHVHASFSEGIASMDAHLAEASRTGVDVVWWTEHDFRLRAHGHRQAVSFDAATEGTGTSEWTWAESVVGGPVTGQSATYVDDPHSPDEPGRALRLRALGPSSTWGSFQVEGQAWNSTCSTSIADTTLELDVLAEQLGVDAELVVEIVSSHRPAAEGRPAGQYTLQYRVGSSAPPGHSLEDDGRLGVVQIAPAAGWQRLVMRPVDDVAVLWPDLVAGDASLWRLRIAVRARSGGTAVAVVDRLRFLRSRRSEPDALAMQIELMSAYATRYPGIRQYQGAELSQTQHINRFGGRPFLPLLDNGLMIKDESVEAAVAMVARVHANGGIASYNHPPAGDPRKLGRVLVETHNLGAELIEVGTGNVEGCAFAFDVAARNAVFVTATGVSDDHQGIDWSYGSPGWITTAWSRSSDEPELVDALRAGRSWFSHLASYGGTMEISVADRAAMGGVLISRDSRVPVTVEASDLPTGSSLEIVTGEADLAGAAYPDPAITTRQVPARDVPAGQVRFDLEPGEGRYVRAVVRSEAGTIIGFSNPTWVFPETPPGGVPVERLL